MSELKMTDGEKMVWAAAFALALSEAFKHSRPMREGAFACTAADAAVHALRSGGHGPGRVEMCELTSDCSDYACQCGPQDHPGQVFRKTGQRTR